MNYIAVDWFDEELDKFYGDTNNGMTHGILLFDNEAQDVIDVQWYLFQSERDKELEQLQKEEANAIN